MRIKRGDLSAPVLAIIVTIGVIAAGLVIMAWFWWFAPTAGKTGAIMISGTPVLFYDKNNNEGRLILTIKNTGNIDVNVDKVIILGVEGTIQNGSPKIIPPGESRSLTVTFTGISVGGRASVEGVILTDAGTYTFTAAVVVT